MDGHPRETEDGHLHILKALSAARLAVDDAGDVQGREHAEEVGNGVLQVGVLAALAGHDEDHGRQVDGGGRRLRALAGAAEGGEHVAQVVPRKPLRDEVGRLGAVGGEGAGREEVPDVGAAAAVTSSGR